MRSAPRAESVVEVALEGFALAAVAALSIFDGGPRSPALETGVGVLDEVVAQTGAIGRHQVFLGNRRVAWFLAVGPLVGIDGHRLHPENRVGGDRVGRDSHQRDVATPSQFVKDRSDAVRVDLRVLCDGGDVVVPNPQPLRRVFDRREVDSPALTVVGGVSVRLGGIVPVLAHLLGEQVADDGAPAVVAFGVGDLVECLPVIVWATERVAGSLSIHPRHYLTPPLRVAYALRGSVHTP